LLGLLVVASNGSTARSSIHVLVVGDDTSVTGTLIVDVALAPVLHDESNRFVVEAESMELESPMQQHSAAMTAISDARQVLQAALMACMRYSLPPEDVLLCLHSKTPLPEEPWDVAVVLRELKQK
jgi:hypothetical protein